MKSPYQTKQKNELLQFLQERSEEHVTAKQIVQHFRNREIQIAPATIYRQLDRLVNEGTVKKYIIDESSCACFQYVDPDSHSPGSSSCYHCKCEKCGRLIHLHCRELEMIQDHLMQEHGFELDPRRMVFYGICSECRKSEE